ncbi:MAG: hypothetical protein ACRD8W_03345 [Nitrososphaeraceae archaeon]
MRKVAFLVAVLLAIFALGYSKVLATPSGSLNLYPPESKPYDKPYDEHVIDFWKWVLSIPKATSPWNDQTGENCTNGQSGSNSSVFYLSGNGGGESDRTCKVPAGKGLFVPVSPMEISDKEAPNSSVEDLHRIAKNDQDSVTSLYLKIDDTQYSREDLGKYRIDTEDFEVIFPEDPVFGVTEGRSVAVADGYYVITEPLEVGNHTIVYKSTLSLPFAQDITYHIIAE